MKYAIRTLILGILMSVSFSGFSAAEPSGAMLRKVEQLKQLKESDPQAYRDFINQKREKVRERYGQLKEQGPEKMGRFMNRHKKRRWERLRKMKEDNPEQFEEFLNRRMSRFSEKAKQNPERFNAMLENRPEFRRRFEQWQGRQDGNKFGERPKDMKPGRDERTADLRQSEFDEGRLVGRGDHPFRIETGEMVRWPQRGSGKEGVSASPSQFMDGPEKGGQEGRPRIREFVGGEDSAQNSRQFGFRTREMTGDKPARPKGHQVDARPVQTNSEQRKKVMPGEPLQRRERGQRPPLQLEGGRKPLRQGGNNPLASGSGPQRESANFR